MLRKLTRNIKVHTANFTTEAIKTTKKPPGLIKKSLKFMLKTFVGFELLSFGTSALFKHVEPGTDLYMNLSPFLQPLEINARVQRSCMTLLYIYLKHDLSERWYAEHENKEEILSEIYKRNAESLLALVNKNGGVYRKIGQEIASMRDFLPDEYCDGLSKLFDQVPAEDFDSISYIFKEDFGKSVDELFLQIDKLPIASASLAQVHKAITLDGKEVAVKVQYPRVQYYYMGDIFTQDLVHKFMQYINPKSQRDDMEEIRKTLEMELNFQKEAENATRAKENFKGQSWVYIPDVYNDLTSPRILTMEYIHGVKGSDPERMKREGFSLPDVATKLFGAIAEQTFTHGFLHADMHGGNFFVRKNPNNLKETQIVLIDHGLYNDMSEDFRLNYCKYWKALIFRDHEFIQEYCDKYSINNPDLLSGMILMQGFDKIGPGPIEDFDNLGKKMTISKRKQFMDSMQDPKIAEDFEQMSKNMPLEMLLIVRTSFLLRSVNQILGAPVNRFSLFARVAARNVDVSDRSTWKGYLKALKNQISFDLRLRLYEFVTWFSSLVVNSLGIDLFVPRGTETILEKNNEIAVELTPSVQD